jgi:hypothetical protein
MNFITDTPVVVTSALDPATTPYLGQSGLVLGFTHDLEPAAPVDTLVRVSFPSGQLWDFYPSELSKDSA